MANLKRQRKTPPNRSDSPPDPPTPGNTGKPDPSDKPAESSNARALRDVAASIAPRHELLKVWFVKSVTFSGNNLRDWAWREPRRVVGEGQDAFLRRIYLTAWGVLVEWEDEHGGKNVRGVPLANIIAWEPAQNE